MKNKLYVSLFAVVASGAVTVSVIGTGRDGQGIDPTELSSMNAEVGSLSTEDIKAKPALSDEVTSRLGSNSATYAPSEDEIFLRKTAQKLNNIANGLSQLRQNHLDIFNRYFAQEGTEESAAFEADDNDEVEDDIESEND